MRPKCISSLIWGRRQRFAKRFRPICCGWAMRDIVTYGLLRYCTKMRFNLRVVQFVDFASPYFVVEARLSSSWSVAQWRHSHSLRRAATSCPWAVSMCSPLHSVASADNRCCLLAAIFPDFPAPYWKPANYKHRAEQKCKQQNNTTCVHWTVTGVVRSSRWWVSEQRMTWSVRTYR